MNILFSVHLYPPTHNCGGEYFLHNMATWLISQGHKCRVLLHQAEKHGITDIYEHEGVEVFPPRRNSEVQLYLWCDVAITHLEYTFSTIGMGRTFKRPVVQVVHNDSEYDCVLVSYKDLNIIYNSQWIANKLHYRHRSTVIHPPVDWRKYDLGKDPIDNEFITLINLNKNKGGEIFREIARILPERRFLGVGGSYEKQFLADLPNVEIWPNSPNILPVYERTRILVMPSWYESWGMTATEAMCNGIPVISTRTPGLMENTAGKMLYCDRLDVGAWVEAIESLDDQDKYRSLSATARERSRELDPMDEFVKLEQFLYDAV